MNKLISSLRKPLRFLCVGFVGAGALFALVMAAMSIGGDAEDVISGLISILFILGLGGLIIYALLAKKDKVALYAGVIALGYFLVSRAINITPFPFSEGFIAYNIFHLIAILGLVGCFALMALGWIMPSMDDAKYRRAGFYLMLGFGCMEVVSALTLLILSIVYGAQGAAVASFVLTSLRDLAFAGAVCFGYLFLFVRDEDFAALPQRAVEEPKPIKEPEPVAEPEAPEEPEPIAEPEPVDEPAAPEEPEPVKESDSPEDKPE